MSEFPGTYPCDQCGKDNEAKHLFTCEKCGAMVGKCCEAPNDRCKKCSERKT
jgi:hypothetical protein